MKYLILLCDGMADRPGAALSGKTPMELAEKPFIDKLARAAEVGLCRTVAAGMKPGSDIANLSVMGYDPADCYTGRSPLEAVSIGVPLMDTDVALRCNLVTLSEEEPYAGKRMLDYCGGDITTDEAGQLIETVGKKFGNEIFSFYPGFSYRHCLVVSNGTTDLGTLTPPHDISGRVIGGYLSDSPNAAPLIELMEKSYDILKDHPVNISRRKNGLRPANSIWLWGEGTRPALTDFKAKNGVSGCVISAVDLLKGIGMCANMRVIEVDGATGYLDTNFEGKAAAAANAFKSGSELVYLHLEAPDECGHRGEAENKVKAIEEIDKRCLRPMLSYLEDCGEPYRILILPDHPTPVELMTHTADPVPYLLFDSRKILPGVERFTEKSAASTGITVEHGPDIMNRLLGM